MTAVLAVINAGKYSMIDYASESSIEFLRVNQFLYEIFLFELNDSRTLSLVLQEPFFFSYSARAAICLLHAPN